MRSLTTPRFALPRFCVAAALTALAVSLSATDLEAQGNSSAAASALGDNYTALARNFNAVFWNPANLGLPGNSRFSLAISPQFGLGTGPVTMSDLADWEGQVVPVDVRNQWLAKVVDNGGQHLGGTLEITPLAISIGPVAFSATTTVQGNGSLPAAVAELMLFGNAGRTGTPQNYELRDLAIDANVTSTLALAYGRRLSAPTGDLAIGVTGKYMIGHGLVSMRDNGSTVTSTPLAVHLDAPMVLTDTGSVQNGSGFGLDVGLAWKLGSIQTGLVLKDAISTFKWNTDELYYMPMRASFDENDSDAELDEIYPLSSAPAPLREELLARVESAKAKPTAVLGVAYTGWRRVILAADVRQRFGDGLALTPSTQVGVGAELRLIPFVPLRAGVTGMNGGMRYSGGIGLEFGVVNLQFSAAQREVDGRSDTAAGFTLSFGGR